MVREPLRAELGIGEDEVVLLFVGHDYRRKGLSTAIRPLERLRGEARVRLLVVGGKRRRSTFSALTQPNPTGVILVGPVDDPVPYYAASDAFVLPTFYDPCSLSVFEAAASGLPSVTTRFNGAAELLSEGVEGFVLADPADDCALCDRLRELMEPSRRRADGRSGTTVGPALHAGPQLRRVDGRLSRVCAAAALPG